MVETAAALADRGWQVTVTLPAPGPLVRELEKTGVTVEFDRSPVLRKSALRPAGLLRLVAEMVRAVPGSVRQVRRAGTDLVYVSTLTIPLWVPIARLLRRPVVVHVHESERNAPLMVRRLLALPLLLATRVLVNSRFSLSVLTDSFRRLGRRAEVLYNGVPGPERFTPPRTELTGGIRLLFVGRLSPRKGPQIAVQALARLREQGTPARLDLVGAVFPGYEWFEQELRETVTGLGLDDAVTFHGFQDDVWPHLAAADALLVPSQGDEPFGNTAVEAALAARPVVVSSSSGLDEATAGYGGAHRVPADDVEAWVSAVQQIAADWSGHRDRVLDDERTARRRHAPEVYREDIERRLAGIGRRAKA
ncbi:glycosyltransferase [Nakamurella sp. YIM 132087]|uniref:Glycosyltransferase n=2 Tax=Nakamurella alba TaxID=2665158 RepID=A0A7K1FF51_9ACTN|nr:glycosyltransferase [Nakamurella alba]